MNVELTITLITDKSKNKRKADLMVEQAWRECDPPDPSEITIRPDGYYERSWYLDILGHQAKVHECDSGGNFVDGVFWDWEGDVDEFEKRLEKSSFKETDDGGEYDGTKFRRFKKGIKI